MPPRPRFASRPVPGPTGPTTLFHVTHERHVRMVEVLARTTTEVAIDLREVEAVTVIDLRPAELGDDVLDEGDPEPRGDGGAA